MGALIRPLRLKQRHFVEQLVADRNLNATAAYRRAYPLCKSDDAARACAARLLTSANIQAAIQAAQQARAERMELSQDYVLQSLKIEAERTGPGSSPAARVRALELMGRHLGMFKGDQATEKANEQNGKTDHDEAHRTAIDRYLAEYDALVARKDTPETIAADLAPYEAVFRQFANRPLDGENGERDAAS